MFSMTSASRSALRTPYVRCAQAARIRYESTSTMHENDPEVLEREKCRNLSKTQRKSSIHDNAPGWNEILASASEAAVKADRSTRKVDELVNKTVQFMRLRDEDDLEGTASTTAPYCRDEVHGPLKGVGKEEVIVERNTVMVNNDGANRVVQEVREEVKKMTSSEENVKADRGEI